MRHTFERLARAVVLSSVLGSLGVLAAAQSQSAKPQEKPPQEQPQQPPRFRTEANFVRVDAYPLKDGKPVLDLTANDFEVQEDGVAQKIETFEQVKVRPVGAQDYVSEPNNVRESLQAAADPRNRVFVIFLDTKHVSLEGSRNITEPLIHLIDRILGPDDLVGVMTTEMAASQMVLARKTAVINGGLRNIWPWGERFSLQPDAREQSYEDCYPPLSSEGKATQGLAQRMIARKRERATLEALQDLVRYLRAIREERKAILTVTEGWFLFTEDPSMLAQRYNPDTGYREPIPGVDPVGVGPTGKLTSKDNYAPDGALTRSECSTDRMRLASLDDKKFLRDLTDEANYANATFYPIDPRGLPVFDTPMAPGQMLPVNLDFAVLRERLDSMLTLAGATDGLAVVNSNDVEKGLRRLSDDLSSYYLLGYYSTNTKLDGRFRTLKVRVKRPGVDVRARRGYRAATAAEVTAARAAADAPVPDATAAVQRAMGRLGRVRPGAKFAINAVGGSKGTIWVAGELLAAGGRSDEFAQGGTAAIDVTAGAVTSTARVTLKPGERTFLTAVAMPPGTTGEISVKARLSAEGSVTPESDAIRFEVGPTIAEPLFFKRGVTTGNRLVPASSATFSRTERIRLEFPVGADAKAGAARLLDRSGKPLPLPVTVGERTDEASGQRWLTADIVLAPLSDGDYVVEIALDAGGSNRMLSAIRVAR